MPMTAERTPMDPQIQDAHGSADSDQNCSYCDCPRELRDTVVDWLWAVLPHNAECAALSFT